MTERDPTWGWRPHRRFDVSLPAPNGVRVKFPSLSDAQLRELQALGKQIQGADPQVIGAAAILAFARGALDLIPPAQLALIEAFVAAETAAGRRLSGWLTNPHINHARISPTR